MLIGTKTLNGMYAPSSRGGVPAMKSFSDLTAQVLGSQGGDMTIEGLYQRQGWFRRCIDLRCDALASLPWEVVPAGSDEAVMQSGQEPPDVLAFLGMLPELLWRLECSYIKHGIAFSLAEQEGVRVTDLVYMAPHTMQPVGYDDRGRAARYLRRIEGEDGRIVASQYLDRADMIVWQAPSSHVEVGPGPAEAVAAKEAAGVLRQVEAFQESYLRKGLVKATILQSEDRITTDTKRDLKTWWRRMMGGARNGGDVEVLNSKITPVIIGEGFKDMSNVAVVREARETVAAALGVPLSLLLPESANYATAERSTLDFYETKVVPRSRMAASCINRDLLGRLGYELRFRPDLLEVYQASELRKAEGLQRLVGAEPILTVQEARSQLGYDDPKADNSGAGPDDPENGTQADAQDDAQADALTEAKTAELRRWRKCVQRKGRGYAFEVKYLTRLEAQEVRHRLEDGMLLDDCFTFTPAL